MRELVPVGENKRFILDPRGAEPTSCPIDTKSRALFQALPTPRRSFHRAGGEDDFAYMLADYATGFLMFKWIDCLDFPSVSSVTGPFTSDTCLTFQVLFGGHAPAVVDFAPDQSEFLPQSILRSTLLGVGPCPRVLSKNEYKNLVPISFSLRLRGEATYTGFRMLRRGRSPGRLRFRP